MNEPQARMAAAAVLSTEANELAFWLDSKRDEKQYHRIRIAVRTEMERLREIARVLTVDDIK